MKYYVKPSLECSKFDVEDIITTSGIEGTAGGASEASKSVYNEFLEAGNSEGAADAGNLVEFEW